MTDFPVSPAMIGALPVRASEPSRYVSCKSVVSLLMAAFLLTAAMVAWRHLHDAAASVFPILWVLGPLLLLHGLQLLLSAAAWQRLLAPLQPVPLRQLLRLRTIREGVDSLLPIAQFGGEVIASSALMRSGLGPGLAVGGIIVDMVSEFFGQLLYLAIGCLVLSALMQRMVWVVWLSLGGATLLASAALLMARRFGFLQLAERVLPRLVQHVSDIPVPAITGLQEMVTRLFANVRALGAATLLHGANWMFGAVEVWIVLRAMGVPVGIGQAITVNTIGLAARTAGVAVPGSLGVQEGGFMLGATLAGLPPQSALVFSLIRRLREVAVGGIAFALWQRDRPVPRQVSADVRKNIVQTAIASDRALVP